MSGPAADAPMLGAVLAGGQSRRFGSDKAVAELDGTPLIALAVRALDQWCGQVVIVGRTSGLAPCVPDWPAAGMGPLGGIAGALRHARDNGFETVLTCGVDAPRLPQDLAALLRPAPAFLADQPVIGLWPVSALAAVEAILEGTGKHSMRALAGALGARAVEPGAPTANVNTPEDLARLSSGRGGRG